MCANPQINQLNTIAVRASYILPILRRFPWWKPRKTVGGGGLSPPEKNQNRNHFVFLGFWVNPLNWQSFTEIGEIACSRTAQCSRGHTLKPMVWVAPQIIQAQGLIIHDIMRKPNSTIVLLHIFQTICKKMILLSEFAKVWENYMGEGLGNQADFEFDMIFSSYII